LTDDTDESPYGMDGVCGQKTIDAIKAFQGDYNLTQDEEFGADGWRAFGPVFPECNLVTKSFVIRRCQSASSDIRFLGG